MQGSLEKIGNSPRPKETTDFAIETFLLMKPFYYLACTVITTIAATKKPELQPYNDPADQLIRMAPMTKSSRWSIYLRNYIWHLTRNGFERIRCGRVGDSICTAPVITVPSVRSFANPMENAFGAIHPSQCGARCPKKRSCPQQQAIINSSPTFRDSAHTVAEPLFCTNWAMSPKYNNQSTHQTVPLSGVFD